jgi:hypothetical protein
MLSNIQDNARTKIETADLTLLLGSGLLRPQYLRSSRHVSPQLMAVFGKSDFLSVSTMTIVIATILGILGALTRRCRRFRAPRRSP